MVLAAVVASDRLLSRTAMVTSWRHAEDNASPNLYC